MRRTFIRGLVPLAALSLVAGACSDTGDEGGEPAPSGSGAAPTTGGTDDTGTTPGSVATGSTPTTAEEVQTGESLLDTVSAADVVRCGVRDDLPGFSSLDDAGEHVGFDADFCRVIAAAVLGDATKVEFVDLETDARFTALQSGEIDVLVRNTTWTASRDGIEGATFLHPTYYDGQQMMVAADAGFESIDDMDGAVVCVAGGTTSEGNVATEFARRDLTVEVQSFEDVDLLQEAFIAGRCDGWSSDGSQLVGLRSSFPDGPDALVIFDDIFSKEPLTPAVRDNDTRWAQAVEWAIYATIQAEEYGITQANVGDMAAGDNAAIVQFLGGENADGVTLDAGLGLDPAFAMNVVSQVGNYGEIFERNLTDLGLERGLNALWGDGGLQYAPPYR
ncbi:MAG: amino acid ABC transporter substrate-binding protein [Acidimicrobiia bacterium]|nr:amino acid ABC transporter substrate-binding protein [Acidimicrobiia bacterium]